MAKAPVPLDFYAGLIRDQERQRETDPVGEALARMRTEDVRRNIVDSPAPDEAAKVNRVARETGDQHALIEDRLPDYEKAMGAQRFADVAARYSVLGKYFSDNPRAAIAAQDDHRSLGILGEAWDTIKKVPESLDVAGYTAMSLANDTFYSLSDIGSAVGYPFRAAAATAINSPIGQALGIPAYDPDKQDAQVETFKQSMRSSLKRRTDAARPAYVSSTQESLLRGLDTSVATVMALLTRNPEVAASTLGTTVGAQGYQDARADGVGPGDAIRYGLTQGSVETLTEVAPASSLLSSLAKRAGPGKTIAKYLAEELPGELSATFLQSLSDWQVRNPEKTYNDWVKSLPDEARQTVLGVLGGGTVTAVAAKTAQVGSDLVRRADDALRAKAHADVLTRFEKAATESKYRARDPEGYSEMIGEVAKQSGVEHVFVPAEAVREYMQSDSYDPYSDPLEAYRDAVDEAYETGGDVVLPSDFALGTLPGTPAWGALREDMRLSSGGMSPREAQTFEEAMADVVAEIETEMARDNAEQDAAIDAQGKLLKSVQDKLMNAGFTPYTAQQQATLIVQRIATRAARLGQQVQGDEFTTEVRQVLPPELAAARDADATDLVINALRKGRDPASQSGPSLLEWISARGGVNDTGGDLASMGLDQWHKGKPGKRKLLRKFDPTLALGGVSGAGDYGIDNTLRAAIEAGYFPELVGVENEAGASQLDTQALLDAMSAELAGVKRYAADARVDGYRAAAEELDQLLQQRGLDPAGMSDAELRAAIAQLDQAGSAEGALVQSPSEYYQSAYEQGREPLASVKGTEIAPARTTIKDLRSKAKDWFEANLRGTSVESRALGKTVTFNSPKKMLAFSGDAQKMRAIPALPEIIAKGELLSTTAPYDKTREPSIRAYHRIGAVIRIGSEVKQVEVTIREDANGNLFYDHVLPENAARNPEAPDYNTGPGESGSFDQVAGSADNFNLQIRALNDGPRGRIRFEQVPVIELFQGRNLSTLLHELGHQYLEELRFDSESPNAPEQLVKDMETVKAWFAANGHPVVDGFIPTEAHELWARGFERYLMEGKAPSSALARVFETFRGWLMSIYKKVEALRSPITPEIREVFDRLLATDEELQQQREAHALMPLFKDAAAIGMTGQEFQAYQEQFTEARVDAQSEVLAKAMREVKARVTKEYRDQRAVVEADVTESVDQRPLFRALRNLKTMPVRKGWLEDNMGLDVFDLMPKRVPPLWSDKGAHPDAVAEMSGYGSGRQMIEALIGAEMAHRQAVEGGDKRTLRERTIQSEVDAIMRERYGDPLTDGTIEREALAAVNGEKQGEVLASELRILSRKTGQRPTPYRIARQWARNKVRQGVYATEASPSAIQRHARAVAKHGSEAEKAMLAGKFDEAFAAKQKQMLSSALLAEAKAANDEVTAAQKRMDKIARRQTSKSVDQDYLDQAHALLEQVDLRPRSQKSIDRQGKWAEWAAAREAEGFDVVVPASFEATLGKTNWTRLPVETMLALDETVQQIMHLGRLKQSLLDGKERREWEEIYKEAEASAGGLKGNPPRDLMEPGFWDAIKSGAASIDGALLKMETVFDWLDGGNSNGVFNRIAFRPVADAQGREQDMLVDYYGRIKALFEAVPGEVASRWQDKVSPPFINRETGLPERMKRHQLIAAALNVGNAGNLQRLTDGYGWNAQALLDYLNSELTAEEWQFVQGVWDTIDTLWPEIEAMERRVNGVAPEKVEATEIVTPFGTLRGGYYPAIYDTTRSYRQEENRAAGENTLFEPNAVRATTRSGSTKARAEQVTAPILLDLGVINRHLGEVIHDITHREAVMQAWKFLTSERVMRAVDQALGPEIRKQFKPWVKFVANSWAMERAGNEGFGKFLTKLRANATVVGMGLRATTMMTQIAGYSNSQEAIGGTWLAEAIARSTASPVESFDFVMANSDEVRHRMDTLDRDIRNELAAMTATNPATKLSRTLLEGRKFFFHGIGYMDRVVVVPTWLAAYNKATAEGMSHDDARYAADKAVRVSQGSGAPKDMAAIQRGTGRYGEALKLMTMFYTYLSAYYQRQRTLYRDATGEDVRRPRDFPKLASRAFWLIVLPPILTEILRAAAGADAGPDDDEWWAQWYLRKLLVNSVGPIPLVRDVFEPAWNKARGGDWFSTSISPIQRGLESIVNTAGDIGNIVRGEETKKATKNALETIGYTTGLIPGQVASAAQFLVDVAEGDADPETWSDWIEGLSTGKIKDE